MRSVTTISALTFASLALSQRLTKPALEPSLDYVKDGFLKYLPIAKSTKHQWNGHIPSDCVSIAQAANLNPADVSTWTVRYDDCSDPWFLCRHKDSQETIETLVDSFGQVPVHMRQWVRHVVALPDASEHAYNSGGNIAIFSTFGKNPAVFIHETGHSLDLNGAFAETPLSSSQLWLSNYALDADVPDGYAQSNQVEDMAQNIVVATYDTNIPGGFPGLEPKSNLIFHQYSTVEGEAKKAPPGNILKAGGHCTRRHGNSAAVPGGAPRPGPKPRSMRIGAREDANHDGIPDVSTSEHLIKIEPMEYDTREACKHYRRGTEGVVLDGMKE